jgi:hypothetical protein
MQTVCVFRITAAIINNMAVNALQCNTEELSCNHCAVEGRVSVFLNLLSGMQIATYLLRVILSQFACLAVLYLSILWHNYRKKIANIKCAF